MIRLAKSLVLALTVLAATTASAAVHLASSGRGQVLLYPYYSAQGGLDTLLSVVNNTDEVKAVRVRFLDAVNARTVAQLNLYLAARDSWVAAVTETADGGARLVRADDSCTVPAIPDGGLAFETTAFGEFIDADGDGLAEQSLETGPGRTADGYVEVLEMGVMDESIDPEPGGSGLQAAAEPQTLDCDRLGAAWAAGGIWAEQRNHDIAAPSGGLSGAASLINVIQGIEWGYRAIAVADFYTPTAGDADDPFQRATLHFAPDDPHPHLADVNTEAETGRAGVARSLVVHEGRVFISDWDLTRAGGAGAADPVSALLTAAAVGNEVVHDETLDGRTNWVVTYPTLRFYLAPSVADAAGNPVQQALDPFGPTHVGELALTYHPVGRIVEQEHLAWTRDGQPVPAGSSCGILCPGPSPFDVDQTVGAAAVLLVGERSEEGLPGARVDDLFGANHGLPFRVGSNRFVESEPIGNGSAEIGLAIDAAPGRVLRSLPDEEAGAVHEYHGLPVIGFAAIRIVNGTLRDEGGQRIRANYGKVTPHILSRSIVTVESR